MEKKAISITIALFAVLFQVSFIPAFFFGIRTPGLILALAISWTVISGFSEIYIWLIFMAVLLDIFSFQRIGINPIFFIAVSYSVGFFSRRFLLDHKIRGILILIIFIAASTAIYYFTAPYFTNLEVINFHDLKNLNLFYYSAGGLIFEIFLNSAFLVIVYFFLKKIENLIFYDEKAKNRKK